MQKIYVGEPIGDGIDMTRKNCHGYNEVRLEGDITPGCVVDTKYENNTIVVFPVDEEDITIRKGETVPYLCYINEVGLCDKYGRYGKTQSKVSCIFLDGGYALLTLYSGCIAVRIENEVYVVNVNAQPLEMKSESTYWLGMNDLRAKFAHGWDYEIFTELSGYNEKYKTGYKNEVGYSGTTTIKPLKDEYVDLSMGYLAAQELLAKRKEQEAQAKKLLDAVTKNNKPEKKSIYAPKKDEDEEDEWSVDDTDTDDEDDDEGWEDDE